MVTDYKRGEARRWDCADQLENEELKTVLRIQDKEDILLELFLKLIDYAEKMDDEDDIEYSGIFLKFIEKGSGKFSNYIFTHVYVFVNTKEEEELKLDYWEGLIYEICLDDGEIDTHAQGETILKIDQQRDYLWIASEDSYPWWVEIIEEAGNQ